jgi:hypothetical protein
MSISTARGRLTLEETPQVNRAATVLYSCFCRHLSSFLYRFDVISAFVTAESGRKTISATRERVRPEVKSPFDSLIPDLAYVGFEIFRLFLPVKSYSTFLICM